MKRSFLIILCLTALVFGVSKTQPQINTVGLILHYKLWAGLTTSALVFDYSLNGNDGTVVSAPPPVFPGFDFDGSGDYINTGDTFQSTFRGDFTLSAWVKPDDGQPSSSSVIMGARNATVQDVVLFNQNSVGSLRIQTTINNIDVIVDSDNIVFANGQESWHHIAAVVDTTAKTMTLYFDGALAGSGSTATQTPTDFTTDQNLWIGVGNNNSVVFLPYAGLIDEPMIFNKTKTAAEIKSIYESTRWRYSI